MTKPSTRCSTPAQTENSDVISSCCSSDSLVESVPLKSTQSNPGLSISIRRYQNGDLPHVQRLFREGMLGIVPEYTRVYFWHVMCFQSSMVSKFLHPFVLSPLVVASLTRAEPTALSGYEFDATSFSVLTIFSVLTANTIAWYVYCRWYTGNAFSTYVKSICTNGDMAKIPDVYSKDGGCFLVATTQINTNDSVDEEHLVGCVGGEFKSILVEDSTDQTKPSEGTCETSQSSGKAVRVYEMKRLNVDFTARGCRVATKLLHQLEKELKDVAMMTFESSNMQYPAHALYRKEGFQVVSRSRPSHSGFSLWRWEKYYNGASKKDGSHCFSKVSSCCSPSTTHTMCSC